MTHRRVQQFLAEVLPATQSGFHYNPVQIDYAASVSEALSQPQGYFHFLEGDTGIGKSLAYMLTLADWWAREPERRKVVLATHSRALQQQLASEQNRRIVAQYLDWAGLASIDIQIRMGRANYVSHRRLSLALGADRLEDVPGEKNRPQVDRDLAEWALSSDGCLLEMNGIELPEELSVNDICLADNEEPPDTVSAQFERAQKAGMSIINTAVLANGLERHNGHIAGTDGKDTVLLIDEAEHFPDMAATLFAQRVSVRATAKLARQLGYAKNAQRWDELLERFKDPGKAGEVSEIDDEMGPPLETTLRAVTHTPKIEEPDSVEQAQWQRLRQTALMLLRRLRAGDQRLVVHFSRVLGLPSVVRGNDMAGYCITKGAQNRRTLLTSATLSDKLDNSLEPEFVYIRNRLGIGKKAHVGVEARHNARDFGRLTFRVPAPTITRMASPLREAGERGLELSKAFAEAAVKEILAGATGRVLVLCNSYADVEVLRSVWPARQLGRWVSHPRGVSVNQVANGLSAQAVLVTPAGWEGLSPQRAGDEAFWSRVVLLRNPTPAIDPVERFLIADYKFSRGLTRTQAQSKAEGILHARLHTQTLHKIRQGIGRALRHPQDRCEIVFLDPRFPTPDKLAREGGMKLGLAAAIPARFIDGYLALADTGKRRAVV